MYDLRPRKTRRPPPDPQTAIRRAAQQPRTGLTNANRGSLQQPRTVGNNVNRGTFSPSTIDNTEQVHIQKCGHYNCKFCDVFDVSSNFISTVTHRVYSVKNFQKSNKKVPVPTISCSSCNTIYLLTCKSCYLQYVGQTIKRISIRTSKHKSDFKRKNTILAQHFRSGPCKGAGFSMQVIEKWDGDGRVKPGGKMCREEESKRVSKENEWILKLRTAYPYGLNEKISEKSNLEKLESVEGNIKGILFPPLPRSFERPRLTARAARSNNKNFDPQLFIDNIKNDFENDKQNVSYNTRVNLFSLRKSHLKALAVELIEILKNCNDDMYQTYVMALDVINTRIYVPPEPKIKRVPPKYQIKIPFTSKAMDFINLPKVLRNQHVMEAGQNLIEEDDVPMVVFNLSQPIRSTILNYNKFVSNLDLVKFQNDPDCIPCRCSNFDKKFCDSNHNHIITGDLSIISNSLLRNLISKGPNFREPAKVDFDVARGAILDGLSTFLETLSEVKKKPKMSFALWQDKIMEVVDAKIHSTKSKFKPSEPVSVLKDENAMKTLKKLHNNFVFVPIDKASNNIAIICKHYYASVILKELDVQNLERNLIDSTYELSTRDVDDIIMEHINFQSNLGLEVKEEFRHLAKHYWTPKMHKQVVAERFITASVLSSVKPLAKDVTKIFKCIFNFIRSYYRIVEFHTGLKYFWVIDNNAEFCKALDRLSKKGKARSIETYDFSTLYTKIPHNKLIECLHFFIDKVFNKKDRRYLSVTSSGAHWVTGKYKGSGTVYDIDNVKNALQFLINNSYFYVGKQVFRQKIGIPMGLDPAPFLANLFLAYYEIHFIDGLRKTDYGRAKKFLNTYRFIDDLTPLNDNGEFERSKSEIYPQELECKKENDGLLEATFLDLEASIIPEEGRFDYHLYDKRDGFNFFIVRFPYACSNIPSKIFLSTIGAETLRICRASSCFEHFIRFCQPFYSRMINQGANVREIKSVFVKFFKRHETIFSKFNKTSEQIMVELRF